MKLSQYIAEERGRQAKLAAGLSCHSVLVYQWARGDRQVPAERCPAIERLTGGVVTCEEMRPDIDWAVLRERAAPELTPTREAA